MSKRRPQVTKTEQAELSRKANAYVNALRATPTRAEYRMCELLDNARISYVFQSCAYTVRSGVLYIPDFRIRRQPGKGDHRRLYVELDGSAHNGREAYDARRTQWLQTHRNATVLRFHNDTVFQDPQTIIDAILLHNPVLKTVYRSKTSTARSKRGVWLKTPLPEPKPTPGPSVAHDMTPRLVKAVRPHGQI